MKVLLLSDTYSAHTEKWARGLADRGIEVGLFSFNKADYQWYDHPRISLLFEPREQINADSFLTKLSYLKYVKLLKRVILRFRPDILHAHYATSYGLVGVLSGFHPLIISVWGSDVYNFPAQSRFHRKIFQFNMQKADLLLSTSHIMKQEIARYSDRSVTVTPFGVDLAAFGKPAERMPGDEIRVGTIKPMEEKYGIKTIIEAAYILKKRDHKMKYRFYLIGSGDTSGYAEMIRSKGLEEHFTITGRIPFSEVARYHQMLDVFLNVSIEDSESFGVATVEAMACERPVIVTDVGGLKEVVDHGRYGVVIPRENAEALAEAIDRVSSDTVSAAELGRSAREHVLRHYDWDKNLDAMISCYRELIGERSELL